MRKITSKQVNVKFIRCSSPITIDKRSDWGNDAANLQLAPNGAFLKMSDDFTVSHLVQPNSDFSAPIGWIPGASLGLFDKSPIFVTDEIVAPGVTVYLATRDGGMSYNLDAPSMVCYNVGPDGQPDLTDGWLQKLSDLQKNYFV